MQPDNPAVAKAAAEIGSTANRYQILGRLAVGGMAEIFLARGAGVAGVERYCVLKRILPERASDAQFVQMFIDEARLAAQLQHPNIASVYDVGMLGESYFFTMEYVHGETVRSLLHRALGRNRPIPLACVLTIIAGAAAGLHHAHERVSGEGRPLGIVHRDVTPSNLMVSYEGNVKIVDFGVAKAADRAVETRSGTVKGKIGYLSPEQCRGARVDRRSDLFSLGIVLWEMLTGARLYRRANDFDNMTAIVTESPPRPSSRRPEVPRAVDDIVLRLLAKSVTDRYQTAGQVVEAIENASMRAGTILSASAVSRLIHDLFGSRAEPWLDLEGDTMPLSPSMILSRPLPKELGTVTPDPVEHELAAVPDLSISSMFEEVYTDDSIASLEPDTLEPDPGAPVRSPAPARNGALVAVDPARAMPPPFADLAGAVAPRSTQAQTVPARRSVLLEALAALPRAPTAAPSALTLRGLPAPSSSAADITIRTTGPVLTASTITAVDRSPAGAAAAAPPEPVIASPPPPISPNAAFGPTLIAPPISSNIAATLISPWPPVNATPPTSFGALLPGVPAPRRPGERHPHHRAPSPPSLVQPRFARHAPSFDSCLTTARWRPSWWFTLRLTPRLIRVIIPAAMLGVLLAWLLMRGDDRASPGIHVDHTAPADAGAPATSTTSDATAALTGPQAATDPEASSTSPIRDSP